MARRREPGGWGAPTGGGGQASRPTAKPAGGGAHGRGTRRGARCEAAHRADGAAARWGHRALPQRDRTTGHAKLRTAAVSHRRQWRGEGVERGDGYGIPNRAPRQWRGGAMRTLRPTAKAHEGGVRQRGAGGEYGEAREAKPRTAPMARRRDGDIAPYRNGTRVWNKRVGARERDTSVGHARVREDVCAARDTRTRARRGTRGRVRGEGRG